MSQWAARLVSLFLSLERAAMGLVALALSGGSMAGQLFGLFEVTASISGAFNAMVARQVDASLTGLLVMCLYMWGLLFVPLMSGASPWLPAGLVLVGIGRMWALWHLRYSYSVGPPSFLRVVKTGPYALVRHPMCAWGLVMRLMFFVALPCWWNFCGLAGMTVAGVAASLLEERFLSQFMVWQRYADRVRWRLVPFVW